MNVSTGLHNFSEYAEHGSQKYIPIVSFWKGTLKNFYFGFKHVEAGHDEASRRWWAPVDHRPGLFMEGLSEMITC